MASEVSDELIEAMRTLRVVEPGLSVKRLVARLQELLPALTGSLGVPSTLLPVLYRKMYKGFVEEVWTSRYLARAIAWIAPQAKQ